MMSLIFYKRSSEMAISIDFSNISSNSLGKQTSNSDQGAIARWSIVPNACGQVENKCGSRKTYFRIFATILVKPCKDKQ